MSSVQISQTPNIPKGRITKVFSKTYEGLKAASVEPEVVEVKAQIKKPKPTESFELFGKVTDSSGEGIANVLIFSQGEFPPLYTNTKGEYRLRFKQSALAELSLNFSRDGYEKQQNTIAIDALKTNPKLQQNFTLTEALDTQSKVTLNGKVSNQLGIGIPYQRIHLITLGDYSENEVRYIIVGSTDENGYFSLENVSINTRYELLVLDSYKYASSKIDEFLVTDNISDLDIFLEDIKLATISGQVVDREGVPLPNIAMNVKNNASVEYNKDLVTDDAGEFQLKNFPEGDVSFHIKSPAEIEVTGIKLKQLNPENIVLPINIGDQFVTGIITDDGGEFIQEALVTLQSTYTENGIYSHSIRTTYSDNTGTFNFENFSSDIHYINIDGDGFKATTIVYEPNLSETNLNIVLERQ